MTSEPKNTAALPKSENCALVKARCTVCLKTDGMVLQDARLSLYRCRDCKHTITAFLEYDPELYSPEYYSKVHKNWFAYPNFPLFLSIHRALRKLMEGRNIRLLDVGSGNGDFLKFMHAQNNDAELHGIDTAECRIPGIHFSQGNFFDFNFSGKYDVVTNLTVIEHVEDVRLFLRKIHELLAPGGIMITTTNNNGGLIYRIARILKKIGLSAAYDRIYSSHHLQHFTNDSLKKLLETGGFEVIRKYNHNYPLKAVDIPPVNFISEALYRAAVAVLFAVSSICGNGFLQTFICRKKLP